MSHEDCAQACDVRAIKNRRPEAAAGRMLTDGEIDRLLGVCAADDSPAGTRDGCVLGLGIYAGMRRYEIAHALRQHYNETTQVLTIPGKGNTTRTMPIAPGLQTALADWLAVREDACPNLFMFINKAKVVKPTKIGDKAIYRILAKRSAQAGVEDVTPHDMRRTFISKLLAIGIDLSTAQRLAGHASPVTTAGYDRRGEEAKETAVARLHMAWEARSG